MIEGRRATLPEELVGKHIAGRFAREVAEAQSREAEPADHESAAPGG